MATQLGFPIESSLKSKHLTDAEFIKGGYLVVNTITERDALPIATETTDGVIVEGSLCYCTADSKFYQYNGTAWAEKEFGTTVEASQTAAGLMSADDKKKLDGIASQANKYEHPSTHSASMITGLAAVATSGSYSDLTNKPTIPTVNNGTLTIQKNGSNVATFSANQSTAATANITVPTKTSDLTNDSGFITGYTETDPTVPSHVKSITSTNISNWGTAYTHSQSTHAPSDAEKNVQSDWSVADTSSDAYIKNKPTTLKNPNALSIGGKSYDGSSAISVTAADLGIANAIHFIGETTTALTDGTTTAAVTISGASKTPASGDVVLYSSKEFIWNGSAWKELGDGSSHALKTVTITAGSGLTGGGDISTNRTLNVGAGEGITVNADSVAHSVPSGAAAEAKGSTASRTYIKTVTTDKFGHVTGVTTGTETVTDTNQTILADGTAFGANDAINIKGGGAVNVIPAGNELLIASNAPTSVEVVGSGNVITDAKLDGATNKLTLTKGATYASTDTNTTYDLSASASKTNGNVTIDLKAGGSGSGTDSVKIKGSGATTVTTDASGVITISSTDTNTDTDTGATSIEVTGSGNAVTAASYDASTRKITLTKGATYNNYSLPAAGTSLGGVKSGGDVTISSGVITVNDDSHNHTIANIDGLQDALNTTLKADEVNLIEDVGDNSVFKIYSAGEQDFDCKYTLINAGKLITSDVSTGDGSWLSPTYLEISDRNGEGTYYGMHGIRSARETDLIAIPAAAKTNDTFATQGWVEQRGSGNTSHTHGNIANDGTLGTASRVVITDANKKVTTSSSITTTELGYLDGVTSNIQTQLDGKAASSHGTHVSYSSTAPNANGTASVGTASTVSRSDHVHPTDTSRAASTHTHGNLANDGTLAFADRVVVTDSNKKMAVSTITHTKLGYLSDVTSNIQAQLSRKVPYSSIAGVAEASGMVSDQSIRIFSRDSGDVMLYSQDSEGETHSIVQTSSNRVFLGACEPINYEEHGDIAIYQNQLDISVTGDANTTDGFDPEITSGISVSSHQVTIGDINGADNDPEYDDMHVNLDADYVNINATYAKVNSSKIMTAKDFKYDSSTGILTIDTTWGN